MTEDDYTSTDLTFNDYIQQSCMSMYEGCMCGLDKNHEDPHICVAADCDETWTTQESITWWKEFVKESQLKKNSKEILDL